MAKRNYKYWHIVADGFGYSVMVFQDRVVFPNEPDIPTLEKANATRYDVRKDNIEKN